MIEIKASLWQLLLGAMTAGVLIGSIGVYITYNNMKDLAFIKLSKIVNKQNTVITELNGSISSDLRLIKELRRQLTHKKRKK